MKFVLDASVALRWVLPVPHSGKALQLRDEYLNQVHELLAPDIFLAEAANALTKAEGQKIIPVGESIHLYGKIVLAAPAFHPYLFLTARALDISSQTRSAFYDCLYVALAEREGCEMVTADDKLIRDLQGQFPFIIHLTNVP